MGVFNKVAKAEPPTAIDIVDNVDVEKNLEDVQLEQRPGAPQHIIDPIMEKKLVRKLDWNLVPLVMAMYLLAFLDRSNIGNAKIAGMSKALDLTTSRYNWLLTIFYISYICFQFGIREFSTWKRV